MELKAKILEVDSGDCSIVLHTSDAAELGVKSLDRVRVRDGSDSFIALVQTTDISILKGFVALYERCWRPYDIHDNDTMTITATTKPASVEIIRKKMDGLELSGEEIRELVEGQKPAVCEDSVSPAALVFHGERVIPLGGVALG